MSDESKLNADQVAGSSKVITNSEEHVKNMQEIDQLMDEAKELSKAESFGEAADKYETAVRKATEFFGEFASECFQPALNYGKTLIEVARLNIQIVDQPPLQELDKIYEEDEADDEEEDEMEDEEKPEEGEEKANQQEGGGEKLAESKEVEEEKSAETNEVAELLAKYQEVVAGDGGAEEKAEEEEDEADDDIRTAWEWLEVARKICENQEQTLYWLEWKSEVLMALGECMSVADEFEQALEEYLNALQIRQKILEPHDRRLAETHFFIALAYKNLGKFGKAADQYEKTKQVLEAKMGHMKKSLESGETNSSEEFTKEIAEIEDLIKSVEENIRDAKESAESSTPKVAELLPETKTLPNNPEEVAAAAAGVEVNDLSAMIKRKTTKRPLAEKSVGNVEMESSKNEVTGIVEDEKKKMEGVEESSMQSPEKKRFKVMEGGGDEEDGGNVAQKTE